MNNRENHPAESKYSLDDLFLKIEIPPGRAIEQHKRERQYKNRQKNHEFEIVKSDDIVIANITKRLQDGARCENFLHSQISGKKELNPKKYARYIKIPFSLMIIAKVQNLLG